MVGTAATALVMTFGVLPVAGASATSGSTAAPGASVVSTSDSGSVKTAVSTKQTRSRSGGSAAVASGQTTPFAGTCYNGYTSGASMYMTCTSDAAGYRVYLDCNNGYRYYFTSPIYYGTWNHTMTCPAPYLAVWGGAWW
ncbi:hypothetical protein ABGB17_33470 [Sphaerisporangium sp. B11E5]|uniref:hypothetical protein n=1 Tax=Sphaerisporangium sp. B11E5 TaxID=3153563 RepID=UPI00325CAB05